MKERILVIKLGALGDLVLCAGAFATIRAHHPDAQIALLTGPAFASFGLSMPWFDAVILDPRPKIGQPMKWIKLIRSVRNFAPTRVYDFQGKLRQTILYYALGRPAWSGAVKGCSMPRPWPPEKGMHYTDFLAAQLAAAGIGFEERSVQKTRKSPLPLEGRVRVGVGDAIPSFQADPPPAKTKDLPKGQVQVSASSPARGEGIPNLSWLDGEVAAFNLPEKFAIIITGCSPQHPHKMWPAASYAQLADRLKDKGLSVVAIGTKADKPSVDAVRALAPHVTDLTGQTSLGQVAALARRAVLVVGNDTGPTHIAAAVGAKTIALMSEKVDPLWSAPRGPHAQWLGGKPLDEVSVEEVFAKQLCPSFSLGQI